MNAPRLPRLTATAALALPLLFLLSASACWSATFLATLGFKDDVDLVTSPNGELLVVCEEQPGGAARVSIVDLDPVTGQPFGVVLSRILPGFEHGVDPIAVSGPIAGNVILVPSESPGGGTAGVLALRLDNAGAVLDEVNINLGNLGFREDVDGYAAPYPTLMAFFPLESEVTGATGALVIDIDPVDAGPPGNAFGSCSLLSSDGRPGCGSLAIMSAIRYLVDGIDPVGYEMIDRVRFLCPAVRPDGLSDVIMLDFDGNTEPPSYLGMNSVRNINAASIRPTNFPGFERDVDLALLDGAAACGLGQRSILIPVEGPGDVGDLYLIDEGGNSIWTLSHDSGTSLTIPGYEIGVDPVILCNLPAGATSRIALPVENAAGTDADLWFVNLATGTLIARVEDPLVNPAPNTVTMPGYEVGVEPLRWTDDYVIVPVEGPDRVGGLKSFNNSGVVQSTFTLPGGMGFILSVDPIVAPLPDADRKLFVPVAKENLDDSDIYIFAAPPGLTVGVGRIESLNPGLVMGGFQLDVDLGLVEKIQNGQAYLYVPERNAAAARLRYQDVPSVGRQLAVMCPGSLGAPAPSLYFFRTSTGLVTNQYHDLLGLVTGLDMANGRGACTSGNPPAQGVPAGYDADTDPTLAWIPGGPSAVPDMGVPQSPAWQIRHLNPFQAPGPIMVKGSKVAANAELAIVNIAGRRVRTIFSGPVGIGEHAFVWDGKDGRGMPVASGLYFLTISGPSGIEAVSRIVITGR